MKINSLLEKLVAEAEPHGARPANSVTVEEFAAAAKIARQTATERLLVKFRAGELDRVKVREVGGRAKLFYFEPVKKPHRRE